MLVMAVVVAVPQFTSRAVSSPLPVSDAPMFVTPWAGKPRRVAPAKSHVPVAVAVPLESRSCGRAMEVAEQSQWPVATGFVSAPSFRMERPPATDRPFRVPLYPLTPLLFCLTCVGMLYSSIAYTGWAGLIGLAVLLAGTPLLLFRRKDDLPAPDSQAGPAASSPVKGDVP